jgi:hypothetical protein
MYLTGTDRMSQTQEASRPIVFLHGDSQNEGSVSFNCIIKDGITTADYKVGCKSNVKKLINQLQHLSKT